MDGAMKFVKGDAIAGIIITLVNIVAGLIIGVLQRGLELGEAARTYALLTIGDGLVSQIPALLISTSAGMIVTRVASEHEEGHLGQDIGSQILAQPKAIAVTAGLLLGLAIIPGLPTIPFLILAAGTGVVAYGLLRSKREADKRAAALEKRRAAEAAELGLPSSAQQPVILTQRDIRRYVKKLVETELPRVTVLSYDELSAELRIQPIARIGI
jgi:type III secretion protein V